MTRSLSVVVCTTGTRPSLLRDCVRSLLDQGVDLPYEVMVVVNHPDVAVLDRTERELEDLREGPVSLGIVYEPVPGASHARNRGITGTGHDIVAFVDDDAIAAPGWAQAHLAMYGAPDAPSAVGGRIEVWWPRDPPTWLPEEFESYFGRLDLGPDPVPMDGVESYPFGGNMSILRSALLDVAGFSGALGRRDRGLLSGEEHELMGRLTARGARLAYQPHALVRHRVEPERVTRRWLARRIFAQGRTRSHMMAGAGRRDGRLYWFGQGLRSLGRATVGSAWVIAWCLVRRQTDRLWLRVGLRVANTMGFAVGCLAQAGRARRAPAGAGR